MLVLLPPSETKRPGGDGAPLSIDDLAFARVAPQRRDAVDALVRLAARPDEMMRTLKLSAGQRGEVEVNGAVRVAGTMPAVDRFTGVLYDALDAPSLRPSARAWLGRRVAIQTALFGPVSALDPIPAYRLAAAHRLPGLPPMRRHWAVAAESAFAGRDEPILDLRSEAYRALGPVPRHLDAAYVRVVADGPDGVRALNHFNKKTKGVYVRALAEAAPELSSIAEVIDFSRAAGFDARHASDAGEILLVARD